MAKQKQVIGARANPRFTVTIGEWRFKWEGGRLADIFHSSHPQDAVDCIQAGPYDWQASKSMATRETLRESAREWVNDHAQEYMDNVVKFL